MILLRGIRFFLLILCDLSLFDHAFTLDTNRSSPQPAREEGFRPTRRFRMVEAEPPRTTPRPSSSTTKPSTTTTATTTTTTPPSNITVVRFPVFPNIGSPNLEGVLDPALKNAMRSVMEFQLSENNIAVDSRTPTTPADLANVENRLSIEAKEASQIAYILEGMTLFVANRSKLTREQIIFGLPKQPARHSTITRRCPYSVPVTCNITAFRNASGLCNNMENAFLGTSGTPYGRFLPQNYSDAIRQIRTDNKGGKLPNPRFISTSVHWPLQGLHPHVNQLLTAWAQFLDHDLSRTASYADPQLRPLNCCATQSRTHPECLSIEVDAADYYNEEDAACMNYVRSAIAPKMGCALGPRDQVNLATHYLDASQLYGNTDQDMQRLREFTGGRLWMTEFENGKSLLPEAFNSTACRPAKDLDTSCFDSGDERVNENLQVASMYTLFAREHNRLVEELVKTNPHWDDEQLYQTARKIVVAQIQHITFTEFLPLLLGRDGIQRHDVEPVSHGYYRGYSTAVNPSITNEFATAAFKFWHNLFANRTQFVDRRGRVSFKNANSQWFQPYDLYFSGALDGVIRGLASQATRAGDQSVTGALTAEWLKVGDVGPNLDLPALTIQRGRDHGLSTYNAWREVCGLKKAAVFEDLLDTMADSNVQILKAVYGSVNDIDLYTGGLCERAESGSLVGPVFSCIIGKQFHNIRRSDRFWYESDMPDSRLTPDQMREIRTTTLARIMCDNGDSIPTIQPQVMVLPDDLLNAPMFCRSTYFHHLDLSAWKEEAPEEPEISRDILLNILEKARQQATAAAMVDLDRAVAQTKKAGVRTAFNSPNMAVRAINVEADIFLLGTKHIVKRQFPRSGPSNMSSALARLHRFNALVQSKVEGPPEDMTCAERLSPCDHTTKFRKTSGWCNNLEHPNWGTSERIFGRILDPAFSDGLDEPRNLSVTGNALPSPRQVQVGVVIDADRPHPRYTHMLMQFGQFMDHDMTLTPIATALNGFNFNCRSCDAKDQVSTNCRPMSVPLNDTFIPAFVNETTKERRCLAFIRSATGRTAFGSREQINQNTAYVDASMIYGSSLCKTNRLRIFVDGKLNSTKHPFGLKDLLPQTINSDDVEFLECKNNVLGNMCFLAGDTRENESPGLTVLHTIWMRFHNDIASGLKSINPHWDDERLFQEARRILTGVFQHVSFNEFLPRILGQSIVNSADLRPRKSGYYAQYDPNCDATLANEFSAAAFRFGHTLVQGEFGRYDSNFLAGNRTRIKLFENFARGDILYEDFGVDQLLIGLTLEPMQSMDSIVTKALTDRLFEDRARNFSGQDLVAINIMRGRDHGVPGYNEFREHCNLTRANDFSELVPYIPIEVVAALQKVYDHVDDVDLYIGGIAEYAVYGGVVGPTFACLIAEQMFRTRRCDRFWYETSDPLLRFSEDQLASIRQMTLSKVACDGSDTMDRIQRSVFDVPDPYLNPHVPCDQIPGLNLKLWHDSNICNFSGVSIPMGKTARLTPCVTCTCTKEGPFCQSVVVRNCRLLVPNFPMQDLLADPVCKTQCAPFLKTKENILGLMSVSDIFAPFV